MNDDAIKLYNSEELAKVLGCSGPTVTWWVKKKIFPQPFAIAGHRGFPLWTEEQVEECKKVYADARKNVNGVYKKVPVLEKPVDLEVKVNEDGTMVCPQCFMPVFDFKIHNDFAHKGKLSIVTSRG